MDNKEILTYIKKSFELKEQGFYKPAIEMLYKALALDNENLEILVQLAYLYKILGNFERALYYIDKVLDIDKSHLEGMLLEEEIYLSQGYFELAKNLSEKIYELQPNNKNLAKKINILNKLNDFDTIKDIEESISDFDDEVLYELACAYNENYDVEKALELLNKGYEKNNKNEKIIFLSAKIHYDKKDFDKSLSLFKELENINATAEVMNYLGLLKLEEKVLQKAERYFLTAKNLDSTNPEYSYNLGSVYFLNGWLDEALKCFNDSICLAPENIDYHYALAYLCYQKKMYDKALKELDFIKTIEQHHEPSNVLSAMIIAKKGDLLTAKNQLENIIKYNEDDFAYSALSKIEKELLMYGNAEKTIKHALELKPDSLDYLSELAEIEMAQEKFEEAQKNLKKIIEINDKYIYAHIALAKLALEKKDIDEVFDIAQKIIKLDSNNPEGYYYNAVALFEQGDKGFAIESLKKSISLDLNNAMLYVKMSEFYQDSGDLKNAYEWAKEAEKIDERNYKYKWLCANLAEALQNMDEALKYYSKSYRLASIDKDLCNDYAKFLTSIGKNKQAKKILA